MYIRNHQGTGSFGEVFSGNVVIGITGLTFVAAVTTNIITSRMCAKPFLADASFTCSLRDFTPFLSAVTGSICTFSLLKKIAIFTQNKFFNDGKSEESELLETNRLLEIN